MHDQPNGGERARPIDEDDEPWTTIQRWEYDEGDPRFLAARPEGGRAQEGEPDGESDIPTDVGESWPGRDAKSSDEPIRLPDGSTIPGDSGPFGEPEHEDTEDQPNDLQGDEA